MGGASAKPKQVWFCIRLAPLLSELQLHLARGDAIDATLSNILLARPCRLYHLVDGAVTRLQVPVCKVVGERIDALGQLKHVKLAVVTLLREKVSVAHSSQWLAVSGQWIAPSHLSPPSPPSRFRQQR